MCEEAGDGGGSRVFLLRIWRQDGWRGRLQDLASGEAFSFAGWPGLAAALKAALPADEPPGEEARRSLSDGGSSR